MISKIRARGGLCRYTVRMVYGGAVNWGDWWIGGLGPRVQSSFGPWARPANCTCQLYLRPAIALARAGLPPSLKTPILYSGFNPKITRIDQFRAHAHETLTTKGLCAFNIYLVGRVGDPHPVKARLR